MAWRFYVYELVDSLTGDVFYVGKGQRKRIDQHEHDAEKGVSSKKCNKIRSIWSAGGSVEKRAVAYFKDEGLAYDFEAERIAEYGLHNLTNIHPGGLGGYTGIVREPRPKDREKELVQLAELPSFHGFIRLAQTGRDWAVNHPVGDAFFKTAQDLVPSLLREIMGCEPARKKLEEYGFSIAR